MARLDWNGSAVRRRVAEAAALGIDKTMSDCVADAKRGHSAYPPASEPGERYANRTGFEVGATRILDNAEGVAGALIDGLTVAGSWGSTARYSLFTEIGTSVAGPTATEREEAADGDMSAIAPPIGPRMAARPTLRPAADQNYPALASYIGMAYRGESLG